MKNLFITLSVAILFFAGARAQSFDYAVDFSHFLDNREYKNVYETSQTMLGARLNAMAGVKIDSTQGFLAGANYLYEYGDKIDGNTPIVNLFYYYRTKTVTGYLGSFPRRNLLNYPLALLSDTLDNYRPNIQGAFLDLHGNWGYENFWCDWTGRQRTNVKEAFTAGFSGLVNITPFLYFNHYFYMFHDAKYADDLPTDDIRDNGAFALLFGSDLTKQTGLRRLIFNIGSLGSYNRQRPDPTLHFKAGFFVQTHIYNGKFGIDASYYKGGQLNVMNGDKLYGSGDYGRFDFAFIPVENKYVSSRAAVCFHVLNGVFQNSEMLSVILKVGEFYKPDRLPTAR